MLHILRRLTTAADQATPNGKALAELERKREIEKNVESIIAIPHALLPNGGARSQLLLMAEHGFDVYAYQSGPSRTWNIWLETMRLTLAEYLAACADLDGDAAARLARLEAQAEEAQAEEAQAEEASR